MQELKIGSTFPYAEDLGLLVGTDSCGYHYQGDLGLDMLVIAYNGVTKKELDTFRKAPLTVGLLPLKNIIFLLLNFEGLDTIEVSFNASINRHSSKKSIEELERNSSLGKPVTIHVVDTKDDKFELLCQRLITFNNKFSLTLLKEAEQHLQTPITKVEYMNLVRGYQAKYTSSQLMSFCKFKHKTND